ACFAETGINVTCVDINAEKIQKLKEGIIPIYEPGLDQLVMRNIEKNRLAFTTSLKDSILDADAVFIAVGTPPDEDGSADLKYVLGVAREIGQNIDHYMVIINKSTVPVGTAKKVKAAIQDEITKRGMEVPFDVASNPEFLKEGNAIEDFLKPDRIVVGIDSEAAQKIMNRLYKPFLLNGHPLIFMDIHSAEMTKYASNAMLATKISFMNDIANLCEIVGADVNMVRKGIGADTRIGNKFIYPGIGYGGSCFPKDVQALIRTGSDNKYSLEILKAVESVNNKQKSVLFDKIKNHYNGSLKGKTFAVWGLSFKPQTDDMREAPSVIIIEKLLSEGAHVKAYDPVAMKEAKHKLGDQISYGKDSYDALLDADALLVITEWPEFRIPNFKVIERLLRNKVIFDGRNIYEPTEMKEMGYTYYSIGRPAVINS
ncbi:MAG: UDP-glucose/GDP-mannose dehydrogenase family protein, partial [Bacteroidales bacterium]|nr:UDP-glucose/GDP-mannose dehydrogenase family protein [Bacteroidales bacterium]